MAFISRIFHPGVALLTGLLVLSLASPADAQDRERRTVSSTRVTSPIKIDGRLDEAFYRDVQPASDFVQIEPIDGAPATEKTEMWLGYDGENFYATFRCWESRIDRVVAKEMRRDSTTI